MARTVPPLVANLSCHLLISLLQVLWPQGCLSAGGRQQHVGGVRRAEWHVLCHRDTGVESGPGPLYTNLPGVGHKGQK